MAFALGLGRGLGLGLGLGLALLQLVQLDAPAPEHSAHVPLHGTHAPASTNVAVGQAATQVVPRWRYGWGGAQLVQFCAGPG